MRHKTSESATPPPNGRKYYQINSLAKGLRIMELLARGGKLSLSEVAGRLELDRSVCHRSLSTMRDLGFVSQDGPAGYRVSMKIFELAMQLVNGLEVRGVVRPLLVDLADRHNETVNLGIRDGREMIYLDKVETRALLRAELAVGTRIPIHCTGLGKAVLAFSPEDERRAILGAGALKAYTPKTIVSARALVAELESIKERGFALDDEEHYPGLRCVAAPVFDHTGRPAYSLSIAGPSSRLSLEKLMDMATDLMDACRLASRLLGAEAGNGAAGRQGFGARAASARRA